MFLHLSDHNPLIWCLQLHLLQYPPMFLHLSDHNLLIWCLQLHLLQNPPMFLHLSDHNPLTWGLQFHLLQHPPMFLHLSYPFWYFIGIYDNRLPMLPSSWSAWTRRVWSLSLVRMMKAKLQTSDISLFVEELVCWRVALSVHSTSNIDKISTCASRDTLEHLFISSQLLTLRPHAECNVTLICWGWSKIID